MEIGGQPVFLYVLSLMSAVGGDTLNPVEMIHIWPARKLLDQDPNLIVKNLPVSERKNRIRFSISTKYPRPPFPILKVLVGILRPILRTPLFLWIVCMILKLDIHNMKLFFL